MLIFLPPSALVWIGVIRAFMLGVSADSQGVVARLLWRTVKIRWPEIETISGAGSDDSIGAAAAPTITWTRSGKTRQTYLNVLGSYNLLRRDKPLSKRAADDLNDRLVRWREENAEAPMS
jgi:hypothetical protein